MTGAAAATVAFVVDDGFEDSEFRVPHDRLALAGHEIVVVGRAAGRTVTGKHEKERAVVEMAASACDPDGIDAVVVPGGWSPDRLRTDEGVVEFVRAIGRAGKPVAAICHGPSLLIEAGLVSGRRLTSWRSIRTDLLNAGATWEDAEVVRDGNLITSRQPSDLPAFCAELFHALGELR